MKENNVIVTNFYGGGHVFIDTKEFDVYESQPDGEIFIDWFPIEHSIAEAVSILNKKGYITVANCCQGHMPVMSNSKIFDFKLGKIAFREDISIPSFPRGYYSYPMEVGRFSNCLVSSIMEGLKSLPLILGNDGILLDPSRTGNPSLETIDKMKEYLEQTIISQNESLTTWAKSLPFYAIGASKTR